jgi:hypothetical protein
MKRISYSTYSNNDRTAEVVKSTHGWEVDLYGTGKLLETRAVHDHSEAYAENVAENFVLGVFDV